MCVVNCSRVNCNLPRPTFVYSSNIEAVLAIFASNTNNIPLGLAVGDWLSHSTGLWLPGEQYLYKMTNTTA